MSEQIRTLVVDDDPHARRRLLSLLEREEGIAVIGECADGAEAIAAISELHPDLVFLDVQMPGVDGFGVVEAVGAARMPVTVFVSAHFEFAIRAFEAYALDYLLKPFDEERFRVAATRAREAVHARRGRNDPRIEALLGYLRTPERPPYPEMLAIKSGSQHRFVPVTDIDYIQADGNHIRIFVERTPRVVSKSLAELEENVLDPRRFVRIHRSTIVNLARIAYVESLFHGDLSITLKDGTRLTCSRRYRARLQERVHFTS
ncbi:MAG: response regulator [Gemmatimonadetes bacterium]|nr:response regulator [Gemmatimonadota bacterium]